MSRNDSGIAISMSWRGPEGKTCERCRRYIRTEDYDPDPGTVDDRAEICRFCAAEAVGKPVVWSCRLDGLGDNESAWTVWEREVPDAEALLRRLMARMRAELIVGERRGGQYSFYQVYSGKTKAYCFSAIRVPPLASRVPTDRTVEFGRDWRVGVNP